MASQVELAVTRTLATVASALHLAELQTALADRPTLAWTVVALLVATTLLPFLLCTRRRPPLRPMASLAPETVRTLVAVLPAGAMTGPRGAVLEELLGLCEHLQAQPFPFHAIELYAAGAFFDLAQCGQEAETQCHVVVRVAGAPLDPSALAAAGGASRDVVRAGGEPKPTEEARLLSEVLAPQITDAARRAHPAPVDAVVAQLRETVQARCVMGGGGLGKARRPRQTTVTRRPPPPRRGGAG